MVGEEAWNRQHEAVFPRVPRSLAASLAMVVRLAGWPFAIALGLQLVIGVIPAGFVLIQSVGPKLVEDSGMPTLLVILGAMFLANGVLNSFLWPFELNQMERIRAELTRVYNEKIASWQGLSMHESAALVSKRTEAKQAVDRAIRLVPSLRGAIASTASTIPLILLAGSISPLFPVILLLGTIPSVLIQIRFDRIVWDLEETFSGIRQRIDSIGRVATDVDYAKDLRTFGMQAWIPRLWRADQSKILSAVARLRYRSAVFLAIGSTLQAATAVITCLLFMDPARPASIVLVLGVLMTFVQSFYGLMYGINDVLAFAGPSRSLMSFVAAKSAVAAELEPVRAAGSAVELDDVSYSYGSSLVLERLNARIPAGALTCIVGPNGAGKSTLIKLLTQLYQPTLGKLRVDSRLSSIAVMNQDFARFPLSIRENLACGRPDLEQDDEQLIRALEEVGLRSILSTVSTDVFAPRASMNWLSTLLHASADTRQQTRATRSGLDAFLYIDADGNGTQLSGGQWQRLAIARTLLHAERTGFALFDEPTSALDPFSEVEILHSIIDRLQDSTLVLVTHRLSQVALADHVIVLDGGQVVAEGSPNQVYLESEWYRRAFDLQAAGYSSP